MDWGKIACGPYPSMGGGALAIAQIVCCGGLGKGYVRIVGKYLANPDKFLDKKRGHGYNFYVDPRRPELAERSVQSGLMLAVILLQGDGHV